jgi:hypothetical protein
MPVVQVREVGMAVRHRGMRMRVAVPIAGIGWRRPGWVWVIVVVLADRPMDVLVHVLQRLVSV